ncbi:MAG: hypothetical protein KC519_18785, partial [Anaerolineae bacterium]|nr:hypothetical protein [Anaerolineae bacterium]
EEAEVERKAREAAIAQRAQTFGRTARLLALVSVIALIILGFTYTSLTGLQGEVATAGATLTTIPQTLTPAQETAQAGGTRIANAEMQGTEIAMEVADSLRLSESLSLSAAADRITAGNGDAQLATLLSIRALRLSPSAQADESLLEALPLMEQGIVFGGDISGIWTMGLSHDITRIALAYRDGTARLRDIATWEETMVLEGHEDIVCSALFSHDDRYIVTNSFDDTARIWDAETGAPLAIMRGHTDDTCSASFSPDDTRVATGGDTTVRIWDVATGEQLHVLEGHTNSIFTVEYSPDGRYIASGGVDRTTRIWNAETGELLHTLRGHDLTVFTLAFSPDSRMLLTGSSDRTAKLWDVETGALIRTLRGHSADVSAAAFSPDGRRIMTGSVDRSVRVWDTASGQSIQTLLGHHNNVFLTVFVDNFRAITGSTDGTLREWRFGGNQSARLMTAHTDQLYTMAVSPDGSQVATAGNDLVARVWDTNTGQILRTFVGHQDSITSVRFSPDGSRLLTSSSDGSVRVWDIAKGELITILVDREGVPAYVAEFSPDGQQILTGGTRDYGEIEIWDAQTYQKIDTLEPPAAAFVIAFNPDGTRFLSGGADQTLRLWDAQTHEVLMSLDLGVQVYDAVFSPANPDLFALATGDQKVFIYDTSGNQLDTLVGHTDGVYSLSFSPDGSMLASGGIDATARLWRIQDGKGSAFRVLRTHQGPIHSLSFTRDGKEIITTSWDSTAQMHDVDYADLLYYACSRVSRDLTSIERFRYEIRDQEPTCPQFGTQTLAMLPTPTPIADLVLPVWTAIPSPTLYVGPVVTARDILEVPIGASISVDGDLSDWNEDQFITVTTGTNTSDDPAENGSFRFAVAVDENNLYLAMTTPDQMLVTGQHDENFWDEDSFEFYINTSGVLDAASYGDGIYQANVNALNIDNPEPQTSTLTGFDLAEVPAQAITFHTDDGWGFEAVFPFGDYHPVEGTQIGFQAQLNGSAGGDRNVKLIWSTLDTTDDSWRYPYLFGRILFVAPES